MYNELSINVNSMKRAWHIITLMTLIASFLLLCNCNCNSNYVEKIVEDLRNVLWDMHCLIILFTTGESHTKILGNLRLLNRNNNWRKRIKVIRPNNNLEDYIFYFNQVGNCSVYNNKTNWFVVLMFTSVSISFALVYALIILLLNFKNIL